MESSYKMRGVRDFQVEEGKEPFEYITMFEKTTCR